MRIGDYVRYQRGKWRVVHKKRWLDDKNGNLVMLLCIHRGNKWIGVYESEVTPWVAH